MVKSKRHNKPVPEDDSYNDLTADASGGVHTASRRSDSKQRHGDASSAADSGSKFRDESKCEVKKRIRNTIEPKFSFCCVKAGHQWNMNSKDARYKHGKRYPECLYLKREA